MTTTVKTVYKAANSGYLLLGLIIGSWLVAATVFCLLEGTGFVDSLYWAMTTLSTVGYGDLSPATTAGKFFTMAFQAWSIFFVVPCAVAHIIDKIRRDEHKFTHDEQEWQQQSLLDIASAVGVQLATPPADVDYQED